MSDKLFNRGIQIINTAEEDLSSAVIRSEKDLYDEILKIFENVTITNGKLSSNEKTDEFLLSLDRRLGRALKNSGYTSSVDKYLTNFDKIAENVKKVQEEVNGINLLASQIDPYKRIEVSNTWDNLLGSGVNKSFVQPVRQGLYRNIMFGASVSDVEKLVKDFVITKKDADSKLLRYVKQVSRDSLSQFDGGLQQKIASELNLNAIRYVGSLIVDSRAQCRKWTGSGIILLDEEFEKEIQKAIAGNLYFDGQRSSGMIKETTLSNFMANRGGYNCRHRAIATKAPKVNKKINKEEVIKNEVVTENDYKKASQKEWYRSYSSSGGKSYEEKTINLYSQRGYYVNYNIRQNKIDEFDKAFIKNLDISLNIAEKYEGDVYRGIIADRGYTEELRKNIGGELKWEGYTSTTKNIKVVESFQSKNNFTEAVTFKIKSKNGYDISQYADVKGEQEVLFKRNTNFKIIDIDKNGVVILEEI